MKTAHWYFDLISFFAYLQSEVLQRFDGKLARRLNVPDLEARCNSPEVKSQLLQHGEQALAIDGELFRGFDATDLALDYLADPAMFARGEYPRIDSLPVGAARKEVA